MVLILPAIGIQLSAIDVDFEVDVWGAYQVAALYGRHTSVMANLD